MSAVRLAVVLSCLAVAPTWAVGSSGATPPRVTVIGDSAAAAIRLHKPARVRLARGIALRLELAVCRRLARLSCPYEGTRPANLVEVVESIDTGLGETVIVAVGYNDGEDDYPGDLVTALTALREAGVQRILWVTLHAVRDAHFAMNDAIRDAAARNPDVSLVDWHRHSRDHPDWFQPDGIHLTDRGAEAMAGLFHGALVELDVPLAAPIVMSVTPRALQAARVGSRLRVTLHARGGKPPYRWALDGKRPAGVVLSPTGRLSWLPRTAGRLSIAVRVADVDGAFARRVLHLSSR